MNTLEVTHEELEVILFHSLILTFGKDGPQLYSVSKLS